MLVSLATTTGLRVDEYRCDGSRAAADERCDRHEIVFVRRGAFEIDAERGRSFVDSRSVLLFHRGERFRVRHPAQCGDRCLVLGFDDRLLESLEPSRALDAARPESPFRSLTLPCTRELHAAADRLRSRLIEHGDPLLAAEGAAALAARALDATTEARSARPPRPVENELVEAARVELARHLGEHPTLQELGEALATSGYRLARLFRSVTGSSLHQYRLDLRLREAHARLLEGERDLTRLALDLGFADHAHFTNSFRRRYGSPPTEVRAARPRRLTAPRPRHPPTAAA